ncbi:MAG: ATP-grasp fold amidoligase family protein [Pseudomonadota bacterium]
MPEIPRPTPQRLEADTALIRLADAAILWAVRLSVPLRHPRTYRWYARRYAGTARWPDAALPRTLDDKFLWRKVFDRDPRFVILSDKLAVKDWVANHCPGLGTARVLWVGDRAADIPDDVFEGPVVVKANHAWNTNFFAVDGPPDRSRMEPEVDRYLRVDHGTDDLQWAYWPIDRKLFVEEFLGPDAEELMELKIYTFGERIERMIAIYGRYGAMSADVWSPDKNGALARTDEVAAVSPTRAQRDMNAPAARAVDYARILGAPFDHMRIDFISDGTHLWLGELTVYNLKGHMAHMGADPDHPLNAAWDLRRSWFLSTPQSGWRRLYARALGRVLERRARH